MVSLIFLSLAAKAQFNVKVLVQAPKNTVGSLFIAGSFNDWSPNSSAYRLEKKENQHYSIHLHLPKGNYEFKISRGNWDKAESTNQGKAIANRSFSVNGDTTIQLSVADWTDHFTQTPEVYQYSKQVHLIDSAFFMPQLNKHRVIWIYLPRNYGRSKKKYPVIYMQDAQNLFHTTPIRNNEWAVDAVMDSLTDAGTKEMIVVGIAHGGKDRLIEYNPYDSKFGKTEGKAYTVFLVKTLKPFIDKHFRTLSTAKNTAIAGSSMGGLISMYAINAYPKTFGAAGIFSPSFWLAPKIYDEVATNLKALKNHKIFFVAGDKESADMVTDMKKMFNLLNPNGLDKNIIFSEQPDGKHSEWFWHREFVPFYKFIAQ
ncbi:MAG: hypothetical protein H7325_07320 [Pedobacter sp.]|nr:hypothetical protein [Pedobacter sp.]